MSGVSSNRCSCKMCYCAAIVPRRKTSFEVLADSRAMSVILNLLLLLFVGLLIFAFIETKNCEANPKCEKLDLRYCKTSHGAAASVGQGHSECHEGDSSCAHDEHSTQGQKHAHAQGHKHAHADVHEHTHAHAHAHTSRSDR